MTFYCNPRVFTRAEIVDLIAMWLRDTLKADVTITVNYGDGDYTCKVKKISETVNAT